MGEVREKKMEDVVPSLQDLAWRNIIPSN